MRDPTRGAMKGLVALAGLMARERSLKANVHLGMVLSLVAGAINAGGFLAVGRYTSHMTGILSTGADELALGHFGTALAAAVILVTFLSGAATTALLVNWGERRRLACAYGVPLLLEAALLLLFGLTGGVLDGHTAIRVPVAILLLAYMMGLQNAIVTHISSAEIRTTHMTGMITDLGIELGRFLYVNRHEGLEPVKMRRAKVSLQLRLIGCFFAGGVAGALGFSHFGYISTVPLAMLLLFLATPVLGRDIRLHVRGRRLRRSAERHQILENDESLHR